MAGTNTDKTNHPTPRTSWILTLLSGRYVAIALCATSSSVFGSDDAAKLAFFESKIRPVLVDQCYDCHSAEAGKSKGDLFLDSRAAWQLGGESGPAIIPGKPDESLLIQAISRSGETPEMPPKSHLSKSVINDFKQWVADGAIDPRDGEAPVHEKEIIDIAAGLHRLAGRWHRRRPIA